MSASTLSEQLVKYLTDVHAMEVQALAQMRKAPELAGDPQLASAFETHCTETERHEALIRERLQAHDATPSRIEDLLGKLSGKGFTLFAQANPDTPGKLAAFAYAFEHLEIGGYEQLQRVAARAEDDETVAVVQTILEQERDAAATLKAAFPEAARLALGPADARSRS
jgi:ferritin-like metal-binding protein YciE